MEMSVVVIGVDVAGVGVPVFNIVPIEPDFPLPREFQQQYQNQLSVYSLREMSFLSNRFSGASGSNEKSANPLGSSNQMRPRCISKRTNRPRNRWSEMKTCFDWRAQYSNQGPPDGLPGRTYGTRLLPFPRIQGPGKVDEKMGKW